MRSAPTCGYLGWTAAVVAFVALLGCSSDSEPEPTVSPLAQQPSGDKKVDAGGDPPDFEADFDSPPDDDPDPANVDPTPPDTDQCIDKNDPGSAENVAKALPDTTDCDENFKTVSGVAKGPVDVDFYKLSAQDEFGCRLQTHFEGTTAGTEICVFARCKNSTVDAVTGCKDGSETKSDIGMKGCCAAAPGKALPDWDCSGVTDDDSADFFIRVRQVNGNLCLPYKFNYRY